MKIKAIEDSTETPKDLRTIADYIEQGAKRKQPDVYRSKLKGSRGVSYFRSGRCTHGRIQYRVAEPPVVRLIIAQFWIIMTARCMRRCCWRRQRVRRILTG